MKPKPPTVLVCAPSVNYRSSLIGNTFGVSYSLQDGKITENNSSISILGLILSSLFVLWKFMRILSCPFDELMFLKVRPKHFRALKASVLMWMCSGGVCISTSSAIFGFVWWTPTSKKYWLDLQNLLIYSK